MNVVDGSFAGLPADAGTYALTLRMGAAVELEVGALGRRRFPPGFYVYVGSARGPGGLRARVRHHQRRHPRPRWHLDYLGSVARLSTVWYCVHPEPLEEHWAEAVSRLEGGTTPVPRFGASDRPHGCHLFRFPKAPSLDEFRRLLRPDHPRVELAAAGE